MDSTDAPLSVQKQDPPMEPTETPGDITEDTVSLEHFLIGRSRQVEKKKNIFHIFVQRSSLFILNLYE